MAEKGHDRQNCKIMFNIYYDPCKIEFELTHQYILRQKKAH